MNFKRLFISLALPLFAGFVGSIFTKQAVSTWFLYLKKPIFNPPNWVFGPVWTVLYIMMGISIYLIWQKSSKTKGGENVRLLFWVHLFFNGTWSIMFFGLQNPLLGFINIIIIWVFIILLMIKFWPISKWASVLLVPYFLWVSFASVLNYYILILN